MIRLLPLLLLSACATAREHATCANARVAVELARQAVARICPVAP